MTFMSNSVALSLDSNTCMISVSSPDLVISLFNDSALHWLWYFSGKSCQKFVPPRTFHVIEFPNYRSITPSV